MHTESQTFYFSKYFELYHCLFTVDITDLRYLRFVWQSLRNEMQRVANVEKKFALYRILELFYCHGMIVFY